MLPASRRPAGAGNPRQADEAATAGRPAPGPRGRRLGDGGLATRTITLSSYRPGGPRARVRPSARPTSSCRSRPPMPMTLEIPIPTGGRVMISCAPVPRHDRPTGPRDHVGDPRPVPPRSRCPHRAPSAAAPAPRARPFEPISSATDTLSLNSSVCNPRRAPCEPRSPRCRARPRRSGVLASGERARPRPPVTWLSLRPPRLRRPAQRAPDRRLPAPFRASSPDCARTAITTSPAVASPAPRRRTPLPPGPPGWRATHQAAAPRRPPAHACRR